ncbi:DUF2167 domain-containing protein [Massilia niastensis]|uniref:DUF2167 domain-containing protein n=1 Tax=Massilia niastensis TaxID=544911 RepID=UPI00036B59D1|nr:DUF2167 domain-containing protein [Massilia niastensis]
MQRLVAALLLCLSFGLACAQTGVQPVASGQAAEELLASLRFQRGGITLPGAVATLDLPASFRYLAPADTARLLEQGWGNPPGLRTLGMIVPSGASPLGAGGWGVVITYDPGGHVLEGDAAGIDYAMLLEAIKESMAQENRVRRKQGYPAMTLVGWAERPYYDAAGHKLYWAKELHTEGAPVNGLNYSVRVLGRDGVLVLNAVAGIGQLEQVRSEMRKVAAFTHFTPGRRYADFHPGADRVAGYGIAALVTGGVAARLGLSDKLPALATPLAAILLALATLVLVSLAWQLFRRGRGLSLGR